MPLTQKAKFAYLSTSTGFSFISSAYTFYYVKVFMNLYHIEERWFQAAQVLYLIWNAINDPLFAYFQDSTNFKFTKTRRESIKFSGPLFALSFILPWIPWGDNSLLVGLHLIVSLFIWDTLFTFVGLAMCALSTELSPNTSDRIILNRYQQIGYLIGSSSVMMLEYTSDSLHNFRAFQITAIFISACSMFLFYYAGQNAHTEYDLMKMTNSNNEENISHNKTMNESYWRQTWQILSDRNFLAFVVANFCQEFHRTFLNNFFAILCDQLVSSQDIPSYLRKMLYGVVTILPQVLLIFGTSLISRYSYFHIIRASHIYKIVAGLTMCVIGQGHPWCLMLFLLLDSSFANASYALITLPLSDIADTNMIKYNRKHPISSMIFGTNALIVKPAISLSPMFVVAILKKYGYKELEENSRDSSSVELKQAMFLLICCYPVINGMIQFTSWSFFTIRKRSRQLLIDI